MRSSSRSMRIMHLSEPLGSFAENNLLAAFISPFAVVELSTGIGLSILSNDWTLTANWRLHMNVFCSILCRGKIPSAALPATWQASPWMYEVGKFNQSLLAGAFLGIMLGPAIAYQKSASDCSLERYRKLGSLSGMVRAEAFQWNHKWYGYWAKQRQAVKTYARTVLLSACWLYCASFAKLKKCLEQAWNRKDKP